MSSKIQRAKSAHPSISRSPGSARRSRPPTHPLRTTSAPARKPKLSTSSLWSPFPESRASSGKSNCTRRDSAFSSWTSRAATAKANLVGEIDVWSDEELEGWKVDNHSPRKERRYTRSASVKVGIVLCSILDCIVYNEHRHDLSVPISRHK